MDVSAVSSLCCCPKNSEHYGTLTNWSTLIKKLMQTYIVKVSGSILNISTVHLNGIDISYDVIIQMNRGDVKNTPRDFDDIRLH